MKNFKPEKSDEKTLVPLITQKYNQCYFNKQNIYEIYQFKTSNQYTKLTMKRNNSEMK